jgi:diguanylate cyclase (GGDEF)-like protein
LQDNIKRYEYEIGFVDEITSIVQELASLQNDNHLLVYIYAYMHNTVIVQSLKKELALHVQKAQIHLLKHQQRRGARVVVYTLASQEDVGELQGIILTSIDTKLQQTQTQLQNCKQEILKKYFHDQLTGLPNIFQLRKDLQEYEDVTLINITLDDFKSINSFYGFMVGDYVLERVGEYLRHIENVQVYKMPGGEFILLVKHFFAYYELQKYLQNLYEKIIQFHVDYNEAHISLDFTIAAVTAHSIDNILAKLSAALMYAQNNKLTYYIYEDQLEFDNNFKENLIQLIKVRDAIKKDYIVAYYQPIIDNKTSKISKYETLARLVDEDGEILAPDQFLNLSKKTKLYNLITKKMVRSAFATFAHSDFEFSINISKEDIVNSDTYAFIIDQLKNSKISHKVVFEFLESDAIIEEKRILEFVTEIKRYGAKIAIDDFGSGYSNFSMLINMKVDYIKIDGSLIANIDKNWSSYTVVASIVEFAKKLGVEVIAEYVHSSTILSKVKALGIEYSQGFYIDKPRIDINNHII